MILLRLTGLVELCAELISRGVNVPTWAICSRSGQSGRDAHFEINWQRDLTRRMRICNVLVWWTARIADHFLVDLLIRNLTGLPY